MVEPTGNADDDTDPLASWDQPTDPETEARQIAEMMTEHKADMAEHHAERLSTLKRGLWNDERQHREIDDLLRGCIRLAAAWYEADPSKTIGDQLAAIGDWLHIRCVDWSAFPEAVTVLADKFAPYSYDHHHSEMRALRDTKLDG